MDVLLNEVFYDPEGADGGYEFVELGARSGTPADADLAGWTLETGNGADGAWRIAWVGAAGQTLRSGLFLIGEGGVDPRPDAIVDLDLQNGPDACRLRAPSGEIDVLGWGAELPAGFFEGAAAADVSGLSLARFPDGVDAHSNVTDFRAAAPTPGDFNAPLVLPLVESWRFPPRDHPVGSAWAFEARVRNGGRLPWHEPLRVRCRVHPAETLASLTRDAPLMPGEAGDVLAHAWPPRGSHLPVTEPPAPTPAEPWHGGGEDLAVTEVFAHPAAGDAEWVELRALSDESVDLGLAEMRDAADSGGKLRGVLPPRGFVLATEDSLLFAARWTVPPGVLVTEMSPWPALNHTGNPDEVSESLRIIAFADRNAIPWTLASASLPGGLRESVSWERISLGLSAEGLASWGESLDPSGATPGRENSRPADRVVDAAGGALVVTPTPFRPWRDGAALVVWRPPHPLATCRMVVHDSAGRVVAALSPWIAAGGEYRAMWDGRSATGDVSTLGLYLVSATAPGTPSRRATLVLAP